MNNMQVLQFDDLNSFIQSRKAETEMKILQAGRKRAFRYRPRDAEEIAVLNQICLLR